MISVAAGHTGCSPFGRYVCLVNNSVTTMETSFLMKQKGDDYCRYCELDRGGYTCSADFLLSGEIFHRYTVGYTNTCMVLSFIR